MPPPTWSPTAKRVIVIGLFLGVLLLLYNVRSVLPPFAMAVVVAYILNPLVEMLTRVTRRSRTSVVALIYVFLLIVLILTIILVVPTLLRQIQAVNIDIEEVTGQARDLFANYSQIQVGDFTLDVTALSGEIREAIQSTVKFLAARTGGLVVDIVSGFVWTLLILLVSFYLLKDTNSVPGALRRLAPASYHADMDTLFDEINAVLSNYLRGQLLLALVIGMVTAVSLTLIGVRNAFLFGVLAGVLEVVPNVGPILASIPPIISALFQGSTRLDMENYWFALLVVGLYLVIQQLENNILAPRIIGESVNLHPVVVLFAALAGASLAGLLGVILAIPVTATGRIVFSYVRRKLRE